MNQRHLFIYTLLFMMSLYTMDAESATAYSYKEPTPQLIETYKNTFPTFLKSQHSNLTALRYCPTFCVKAILKIQGLSEVSPDEAYAFLNRALSDEKALINALNDLEKDETNMTYLKKIFRQLNACEKKNRAQLTHIMHTDGNQHPYMLDSKKMKEETDAKFFPFAACQLLAIHLLESEGPARIMHEKEKE